MMCRVVNNGEKMGVVSHLFVRSSERGQALMSREKAVENATRSTEYSALYSLSILKPLVATRHKL